jgi:cation transport ATPase
LSKIEAHAQVEGDRKYEAEKEEHSKTKIELGRRTTERDDEAKKNQELQNKVVEQQENFSTTIAKIITIAIFGIPYLAISVLIVLIQNQYGTPTIKGIAWISVTVLAGLLLAVLHKKLFLSIKKKVKDKL